VSCYRYKITLEYLGKGYCGWQRQKEALSLQKIIEDAIFAFTKERVSLIVAGRTDAGVHAYGQVAHFDLSQEHDLKKLMYSINHFARPHTIGVVDSKMVDTDFHARFSAKARHYVYKILNRGSVNIINKDLEYHIRDFLDIEEMQKGANYLLGRHDFTSFRASECQSNSPIRTLDKIEIVKNGESEIRLYFSSLSFLHHMVRNITGSLIMVGSGKWKAEKIKEVLDTKDRRVAASTAPAHGLYFIRVDY